MKIPKMKIPFRNKAPLILSILGCFGVVGTGIVAAIQTPKALKRIEETHAETIPQKVLAAAPAYLPALGVAGGTIASVLGAHALNRKQQASLVAGYAMLDQSYKAFRKKAKELYGEDAEKDIRAEIAKDAFEAQKHDISDKPSIKDEVLFYCDLANPGEQFFYRTMDEVHRAEYLLNKKMAVKGYATINDFLKYLGLPENRYGGDVVGWSIVYLEVDFEWPWIDFMIESIEPGKDNPDDPIYYEIYPIAPPTEDLFSAPDGRY